MSDKCSLQLQEKLKEFYKGKELELKSAEFELEIDNALKDAKKEGADPIKFIEERINSNIRDIKMEARARVLQVNANERLKAQAAQFKNSQQGIESAIHAQPGKQYVGHAGNVESKVAAERRTRAAAIMNNLEELDGGIERTLTGEFDDDVMRLIMNEVSEADMGTIPREAHIIYNAVKKNNDFDYMRKIEVGANVKFKKNRVFKQRHSARNMRILGEQAWTEKAARDFDPESILEIARTQAKGNENKLNAIELDPEKAKADWFASQYKKILDNEGKQGIDIEDDFKSITFTGQKSSLEKSASIRFRDSAAQLRYNREVNGKTVMSMVLEDVRDNAGYIGSAEVFGPNPKAGFTKMIADGKDLKIKSLEGKFKLASGRRAGVARGFLPKSADKVRKIADVTKLGTAIFSTLPDFSLGAFIISSTTGKPFFSAFGDLVTETIKNVPTKHRREVQRRLAVYTDDFMYGNLNSRIGEDSGLISNTFDDFSIANSKKAVADRDFDAMANQAGSLVDAGHRKFMKYTGLPAQSEIIRTALAKNMAEHMNDIAGQSFGELYKGTKNTMDRFNIGEKEWDLLRKHGGVELSDGTKVIDTDSIGGFTKEMTGHETQGASDRYLGELASNYSSMLTFVAEHGSPTPGVKTKAWVDSIDPNTAAGIMMRFMGQYKSFSIAVMDTIKEGLGPDIDASRIGKFGMAAITGMGLAYMGDTAKKMVQGKDPQSFMDDRGKFNGKLAKDMLLRAGTGGLWLDFLATDYNSTWKALGADLAGPGVGVIESGLKVGHAGLNMMISDDAGKAKTAKRNLINEVERNMPGIPFTKAIVNKQIFDIIHSAANTGAKR